MSGVKKHKIPECYDSWLFCIFQNPDNCCTILSDTEFRRPCPFRKEVRGSEADFNTIHGCNAIRERTTSSGVTFG